MAENPTTLAVVLHGWRLGFASMDDVEAVVRQTYRDDVRIFRPLLAYHQKWRSIRAAEIVRSTLAGIDAIVKDQGPFERIVIIGHSVGATLARRVYLAAYKTPTNFQREDELASQHHRPWVETVERVVLLAAFNRGWSLTARTSWRYSALFNFIGLVGHIGSATDKAPAIFDFRLGAPFMVQTRLHWLAYRRRPRDASDPRGGREPIFVQLIGNEDDLISPIDQVDISADGKGTPRSSGPVTTRMAPQPPDDFFVIPMANTDHQSAVALTGEDDASGKRRGLFIASLEKDRAALKALAMDPSLLADQVDPIDETVKDTVFVIHGIRDDGFWTHRIAGTVRKTALVRGAEYRGWTPTYGYFAMLPFVLPWIRRQKVEWFMDQYVSAFAQYPSSDFHFVGHSNGTYLAARALEIYPAFHLKRVFFAGSVVRSNYAWGLFINAKRVETLQNVCAAADWVVAWLPKSLEWLHAFDLGGAGFDGFHEADENPSIHELKYVSGCHSSARRRAALSEKTEPLRFLGVEAAVVPAGGGRVGPARTDEPDLVGVTPGRSRLEDARPGHLLRRDPARHHTRIGDPLSSFRRS